MELVEYLGGYVDGDGSICLHHSPSKKGPRFSAVLSITALANAPAIEKIVEAFRAFQVNPYLIDVRGGRHTEVRITKMAHINKCVNSLLPHLIAKKLQLELAGMAVKHRVAGDETEVKKLVERVRDLNKRGVVRGSRADMTNAVPSNGWASGVVDSDGNLYLQKNKYPVLRVFNTDMRIIKGFENYCSSVGVQWKEYKEKPRNSNMAEQTVISVSGDDALFLASTLTLFNKSFRSSETTRAISI